MLLGLLRGELSCGGDLRLDVSVNDAGALVYHVDWKGKPVIVPSGVGFMLADGEDWSAGFDAEVERSITQTIGSWKPVWGERERILDTYHGATVRFGKRVGAGELAVEMRAYNEGVAFRYVLDSVGSRTRLKIEREQTEFRMVADHDVWAVTSAQGKYSKVKMSAMPSTVERPCVLEAGGGPLIAIAEAALVDYSRMRLGPLADAQHALVSKLHGPVEVELPLKTPWRVIMIADQAGELLENNHLLLNLNEPSKLEKTDWIKPGKVRSNLGRLFVMSHCRPKVGWRVWISPWITDCSMSSLMRAGMVMSATRILTRRRFRSVG